MPSNFDIRVVATNGKVTKKILWIKRTARHICYGWDIPTVVGHFTYHESGKQHFKLNDRVVGAESQKIPLRGFKGVVQLGNTGTHKNLSALPHVDFNYKKVDGLVWIDTRTLTSPTDSFGVDFQLVEVGKLDKVYRLPGYKSIHVFMFSNPWIVISTE